MNTEERMARIREVLEERREILPMFTRDLHAVVGEPAHRSDFRKLLSKMEERGEVIVEELGQAAKGQPRVTVRLPNAEDLLREEGVEEPVDRMFRHRYQALCQLLTFLELGGTHEVSGLRQRFVGLSVLWDTVLRNLRARAIVKSTVSDGYIVASVASVRKVLNSEKQFCALAEWNSAHAEHMDALLDSHTPVLTAAHAAQALRHKFGPGLIAERTGRSQSDIGLLLRALRLGDETLQLFSHHDLALHFVAPLESAQPDVRWVLIERIAEEKLNVEEIRALAASDDVLGDVPGRSTEELAEPPEEIPESTPSERSADESIRDMTDSQKLTAVLQLVFGIAEELQTLLQRVDRILQKAQS